MRIVMPLFGYKSSGINRYSFMSYPFSIVKLMSEDIIETKLFSKQDIGYMELESWSLVFDGDVAADYIECSHLLLMSFRVLSPGKAPFIKYPICKEDLHLCSRLDDTMVHNYESDISTKAYCLSDLQQVDTYLGRLIEMKAVSNRTKNALYFALRGMTAYKWIDAFVMYMSAIESLFSKDEAAGATKTIKKRVTCLLNPVIGVTRDDIGVLYALRSDMVHGRVEISDDPKENLRKLAKLERILKACFDIFLRKRLYENYKSMEERNKFMVTLDGS